MSDYSIVQFIVHRMKKGLKFSVVDHDPDGMDFLSDYMVVWPKGNEWDNDVLSLFEKVENDEPKEGVFRMYGNTVWRLKADVHMVEYKGCAGNSNDGSYCSGVEFDIEQVGQNDVFGRWLEEIIILAAPSLDKSKGVDDGDWKAVQIMTLWTYETNTSWDGEWNSETNMVGLLCPSMLSKSVYPDKYCHNCENKGMVKNQPLLGLIPCPQCNKEGICRECKGKGTVEDIFDGWGHSGYQDIQCGACNGKKKQQDEDISKH